MKSMTFSEYEEMYQKKMPSSPLLKDVALSYLVGGLICVLGQCIMNAAAAMGADKVLAGSVTSVTLIFLSALFTGLGLYSKLARFAGAGTVVPITGFANAMVSPAIEHRAEGFVLGVGAKLFTIAGPVLVYGTLSGVLFGTVYYFVNLLR